MAKRGRLDGGSSAPQRRCLACGRSEAKGTLMRFVVAPSARGAPEVCWDRGQQMPGRGGYVHPRLACWARMSDLKRWRYAFRGAVTSDDAVRDVVVAVRAELVASSAVDGSEAVMPGVEVGTGARLGMRRTRR